MKGCGLHQQLAKGVKHLYIVKTPKQAKVEVAGRGSLPVRVVFKKVEGELRRLVKARNKKFERLRGVGSYEVVRGYADKLETALATSGGAGKGIELLQATLATLRALLESASNAYEDCKALDARFQAIHY